MQTVVGVQFKRPGKVYYFSPEGIELVAGDKVVVETARGIEFGNVVGEVKDVPDEEVILPLKKVIRKATEVDQEKVAKNKQRAEEAFNMTVEKINKHHLPMKLVDVEYTFDNTKIVFYFTADGRVDFRELVKDLAGIFRTRIELRQIGVRDQAKMVGGLGPCGRKLCCSAFLGEFHPVSIKMAKEQNLSLNPVKISGICGRLMCCLQYEQAGYEEIKRRMPPFNIEVETPDGKGIVIDIRKLAEKVKVKRILGDGTPEIKEYSLEEISWNKEGVRRKPNRPSENQDIGNQDIEKQLNKESNQDDQPDRVSQKERFKKNNRPKKNYSQSKNIQKEKFQDEK
jgi:cell fate regulator YaaT (PSP1 superfamily)